MEHQCSPIKHASTFKGRSLDLAKEFGVPKVVVQGCVDNFYIHEEEEGSGEVWSMFKKFNGNEEIELKENEDEHKHIYLRKEILYIAVRRREPFIQKHAENSAAPALFFLNNLKRILKQIYMKKAYHKIQIEQELHKIFCNVNAYNL
ncbi:hypothetical protein Tco_0641176 [Tanacetum coccineum]